MGYIKLSGRMKAVADMVIPGGVVADIGCDHAFVSIYLIENNISPHVIASDVRKGPVSIAKSNVESRSLTDRIDVRQGDGLKTLSAGEADTIVIAGMGGMLMIDILKKDEEVASTCRQLILQPQSDIDKVRRYLADSGYFTENEDMLIDDGKYYNILDVRTSGETLLHDENFDLYCKFGKYLLENKNGILRDYMEKQYKVNSGILHGLKDVDTENAKSRLAAIKNEQSMILAAFEKFYSD